MRYIYREPEFCQPFASLDLVARRFFRPPDRLEFITLPEGAGFPLRPVKGFFPRHLSSCSPLVCGFRFFLLFRGTPKRLVSTLFSDHQV